MSVFNRDSALLELRGIRLQALPAAYAKAVASASDDYLWGKVLAAEAEVVRRLSFPIEPTEVFPYEPSDSEIAALNGAPYLVESGYDFPPDFFSPSVWGALKLRMRPVIRIRSISIVYPAGGLTSFTLPDSWIKLDKKAGQVQCFPSGNAQNAPMSIFALQAIGAGVTIPNMVQVRYSAGVDAKNDPAYFDILDLIMRMVVMRIIHDAFLPQSGSISGDGLSQSISADTAKMQESIEHALDDIKTRVLGVIWAVL